MNNYYVVDKSLLPESFSRVIEARKLLSTGKVKNVSEAVKKVGISRASYYKYKDFVYESENNKQRKAVISFLLNHRSGILSEVLNGISKTNANILTINQNIPINNMANVVISLDINNMNISVNEMMNRIRQFKDTSKVRLITIE
ncbi:ACT domain-containing protein [Apilactobacillus micheneri]|uniref:ACT domain-containing protein n=1 Tax=Apilactobacillus micheneri TaxID=1899430 RepID=UPI0011269BEA|nr:ACT domain-containing protein [Apilactobacillus micheneri]TPR43937.1 ACT domain-containing protein [Apilactobacillus micheneri]TPR47709.1 ACT domain-containing protein [Apilactobacillus micheneri]